MKKISINLFLLIFAFYNGQAQELENKNGLEAKANFELQINGKKYQITEGQELKLDTTIFNPSISVKLVDYKKFNNSSISFNYPKHLSFEFSQDFGYKSWSLSGSNLAIIIFELDSKTNLNSLIDETIKKFGKKNCVVESFQKKLGSKLCNGKKMNVSLAGEKMSLEYYEILLNDYKSRFIYFQDVIVDGANSDEYDKVINMVNSSIVFE
jgi:hypothetical protein